MIEGEIIEMSPIRRRHTATVGLVGKALRKVFGDAYWIDNLCDNVQKVHRPPPTRTDQINGHHSATT